MYWNSYTILSFTAKGQKLELHLDEGFMIEGIPARLSRTKENSKAWQLQNTDSSQNQDFHVIGLRCQLHSIPLHIRPFVELCLQ